MSRFLLLLAALVTVHAAPARAVDRTWDGGGDGTTWSDRLNWSGDAVPGGGDHALVTLAGTYTVRLTAATGVARLTLGGPGASPTLDVAGFGFDLGVGPHAVEAGAVYRFDRPGTFSRLDGPLAVRGRLDWGGGQILSSAEPGGPISIAAGGEMRWFGTTQRIVSTTVTNAGTIRWTGGQTVFGLNQRFTNTGLIEAALATDIEVVSTTFGPGGIDNTGTVRKTGAGALTITNVPFRTVGGSVDVQAGAVVLAGSSRLENAAVAVAAGATLRLGGNRFGQRHIVAGMLTGTPAGVFVLGGPPGSFYSTMTAEPGGQLNVGGTGLQLANAELGGSDGTTTFPAPTNAGLLRHVGTDVTYIDGPFVNEGTFRAEGPGRLVYSTGATFANPGVLEFAVTANAEFAMAGRPAPLRNTGTVRKTGAATLTSTVDLNTIGGRVDVQGGAFRQTVSGRWEDATVSIAADATLLLNSNRGNAPQTIAGTLSGTPAGQFVVGTATDFATYLYSDATRPGVLDIGGTGLVVVNGQFGDTGVAAPTNRGLVRLAGPEASVAVAFRNEGTLRWEAGALRFTPGITVANAGRFEIAAGGQTLEGSNFSTGATLVNEAGGTVRTSGTGTVSLRVSLTNRGRLAIAGGVLAFPNTTFNAFLSTREGLISGAGTLDVRELPAARAVNAGRVSPGAADDGADVGTLTLRGSLALDEIALDLGGTTAALHDRIVVQQGTAAFEPSALVTVRAVGGFAPAAGQTFTVVTGTTTGTFGSVVSAVPGVTFAASYPAGGGAVLTAARSGPPATFTVGPNVTVNSAYRTLVLTGTTLAPGVAVRLACTTCLDPAAHGAIRADVLDVSGGVVRVRVDVRSPRVIGVYDVVVEQPGQAALRAPLTVRALASVPVFDPRGLTGIGIRPAPALSWSTVNIYAATNNPGPIVTMVRFQPEVPDAVRIEVNSAYHGYGSPLWVHNTSPEPGLFVYRIRPNRAAPLDIGTGINPEDVAFPASVGGPDQTARGPGRVPFGADFAFTYEGGQHQTQDLLAQNTAQAFINSNNAALNNYAQNLVPGDIGASAGRLNNAIRETMDALPSGAALTPRELMNRVIDRLASTNPPPPGLRDAAERDFRNALDENFRESEKESTDALRDALGPRSPAAVRNGTRSDLDALRANAGGRDADDPFNEKPDPNRVTTAFNQIEEAFNQPPGSPPTPREQEILHRITGPWDPNDKTTGASAYTCELGFVTVDGARVPRCVRYIVPVADAAAPIAYTIHFENKAQATGPAEDVVIRDTLDVRLDPATLRIVGSSSDSTFTHTVVGRVVTFRFDDIRLRPNRVAPEGQGFVIYTVAPRAGWAAGTTIRNRASIVFDFNPPILTPTVEHVRQRPVGTEDGPASEAVLGGVSPNPASAQASLRFSLPEAGSATVAVYDVGGREVLRLVSGETAAGWHTVDVPTGRLASGVYVVRLLSGPHALARTMTVVR